LHFAQGNVDHKSLEICTVSYLVLHKARSREIPSYNTFLSLNTEVLGLGLMYNGRANGPNNDCIWYGSIYAICRVEHWH